MHAAVLPDFFSKISMDIFFHGLCDFKYDVDARQRLTLYAKAIKAFVETDFVPKPGLLRDASANRAGYLIELAMYMFDMPPSKIKKFECVTNILMLKKSFLPVKMFQAMEILITTDVIARRWNIEDGFWLCDMRKIVENL